MVTVPAPVWRGGPVRRALTVGLAVGVSLGALAWIDSGMLVAGVVVFVLLSVFYGGWMARRMSKYWPGAGLLSGAERVAVVRAARRGEHIGDERLAQGVIDYSRGLHAAAETAKPFRWLLWFILSVAVLTAVWDTAFGSVGNGVASCIYLVLLVAELFWWPKRQEQILANAERAEELARRIEFSD